jgi:hypothetical protein
MNIVRKAILRACWQDEKERGLHAARPWLRLLLARVVGIEDIPARDSERILNEKEQYLATRKEEAIRIDPETAEVRWSYGQICDPYGIIRNLPEQYRCTGRVHFARSPGSDVWVCFDDLPNAVHDRLWERLRAGNVKNNDDDLPF